MKRFSVLFPIVGALSLVAGVGIPVASASTSTSSALDSSEVTTLVFSSLVSGDGSPAGHGAGSIEIQSFSWGTTNTGGGTVKGGGSGKVSASSFSVKKSIDKATPILFQMCASGKHVTGATLYFDEPINSSGTASTFDTYMTVQLSNVWISSDSISKASTTGDDRPSESITLNFTKIIITSTPPGGTPTTFSWDGVIKK